MEIVSQKQLESSLDEVLDRVNNGEEICVEHNGQHYAIIKCSDPNNQTRFTDFEPMLAEILGQKNSSDREEQRMLALKEYLQESLNLDVIEDDGLVNANTIIINCAECDDNYCASVSENVLGALVFTADSLTEIILEASKSIDFHVKGMIEDGDEIPDWLAKGEYEMKFVVSNKSLPFKIKHV